MYRCICLSVYIISAVLLVYELPWILQGTYTALIVVRNITLSCSTAAWKIVKSWLGDRAAKKIK